MDEIRNLEPHVRAMALVGGFLQHWALLEDAMNRAIIKGLKLDAISGLVVIKNVQLRDKTKILKTLVHFCIMQEEEKALFKKLIGKIGEFSSYRNMIAHDMFFKSEKNDGVIFMISRANGDLTFPNEDWSVEKFAEIYGKISELREGIVKLMAKMDESDDLKARFAPSIFSPVSRTDGPSLLELLLRPLQEPSDSNPHDASNQNGDENPPPPDTQD